MTKQIIAAITFMITVQLAGCTAAINVKPVDRSRYQIDHVCIKENSKVIVPRFTDMLQEGFIKHGIKTDVYTTVPESCKYSLQYTATQKWDFTTFLNDAHLKLYEGPRLIASADRDAPSGIFGGGGINPSKWKSDRSKIFPLIDEMLKNFDSSETP